MAWKHRDTLPNLVESFCLTLLKYYKIMKKLFTICTVLFALALIGCEHSSDEMFAEIEEQNIEIIDDSNMPVDGLTWDAETE
jgi:formate/nitrite transporter FocA (FNT family)